MARKNCPSRFMRDETGAAAIKYAVMTFIAVAIVVVVGTLGGQVYTLYQSV
jgi:Flp pilus assembly pilin Flp